MWDSPAKRRRLDDSFGRPQAQPRHTHRDQEQDEHDSALSAQSPSLNFVPPSPHPAPTSAPDRSNVNGAAAPTSHPSSAPAPGASPSSIAAATNGHDANEHASAAPADASNANTATDPASVSPMTTWSLDNFTHDPAYLALQQELRTLLFSTAQSAAPTRRSSPVPGAGAEALAGGLGFGVGGTGGEEQVRGMPGEMKRILAQGRRLEYLKNYMGWVAPWLDMFDSRHAFGIQLPALARNSPPLLYAILALSARQMEQKEGTQDSFDSLELYSEAIRLLTPLLQAREQDVIAICVILCCMEMMSASGQDWRRHLDGCAALFDSFGVNGFSDGLQQAVFWCYARMDLCGALMSDGTQSTLIEPSKWLPPGAHPNEARHLFHDANSPDMHANYAVYLCAKVCELLSERTKYVELGEENGCNSQAFATRWEALWYDLQSWLDDRPAALLPVQTIDAKPFPHILFVHWAAISSNQLHHTACILLLNMAPKPQRVRLGPSDTTLSFAKRICGISLTNPHQGCLNNAIQPLWIAGRLLSHRSEHSLLVKLIKSIESQTGWATSWRIGDLETTWGYKVRKGRREGVDMMASPA